MNRDEQRLQAIRLGLDRAELDALVCTLASNVLLTSGYWPVVGTSVAVVGRNRVTVIAPKDEESLARQGWADEVRTFEPGSLERIYDASEVVLPLLAETTGSMGLTGGRIGYEAGEEFQPASYVSMHLYGVRGAELLRRALPQAQLAGADDLLDRLKSIKTEREIEAIRVACGVAQEAFGAGVEHLRPGISEIEGAARFGVRLASPQAVRSAGYVALMSGRNSATAYGSYAMSTQKQLERGELVLVHCNSHVGGFWTDITRTFILGPPDDRRRRMYDAVFAAREAALRAIRPGARARDVDRAARDVLSQRDFGDAFKHPTGHGVGFAAINHNALPRLHPKSQETLETGMVFNVEPGIYLDGQDGMRHCDMVAVTDGGCELLTPFQGDVRALTVS